MKAVIYGRESCNFCDAAKCLCKAFKIDLEYKDVQVGPEGQANMIEMRERVLAETNCEPKSVPQIFVDDDYVGGFDKFDDMMVGERNGG